MRYLAETHIVLWYLNGDEKLPNKARELIDDDKNEIFFSLAVPPKVNLDKFAKANKVVKRSGDFHCFSSTLVFLYLHHKTFVFFLQVFLPSFLRKLRQV